MEKDHDAVVSLAAALLDALTEKEVVRKSDLKLIACLVEVFDYEVSNTQDDLPAQIYRLVRRWQRGKADPGTVWKMSCLSDEQPKRLVIQIEARAQEV